MRPHNALALRVSLETGLRIDDVLGLHKNAVERSRSVVVHEKKTGKPRLVYLPRELREELLMLSGFYYVFRGLKSEQKHRTRQAVYIDMKKAAKALKMHPAHVSPHSARKTFAVKLFKKTKSLERVQKALNHENDKTTLYYAFSDKLRQKPARAGRGH